LSGRFQKAVQEDVSMAMIDLARFGVERKVELEGEVITELAAGRDLALLFDENHDFTDGIQQSLRNACILISEGIVDLVGVEGYPAGVREQAEAEAKKLGFGSVREFVDLVRSRGNADSDIIRSQTPVAGRLLFGLTLVYLRPEAAIHSLEHPDAYMRSRRALEEVKADVKQKARAKILELGKPSTAAGKAANLEELVGRAMDLMQRAMALAMEESTEAYFRLDVQREREQAFVANFLELRGRTGSKGVSIINVGKRHQDELARLLPERGISIIRLRPTGFPVQERI
jgi:hypothetical protein